MNIAKMMKQAQQMQQQVQGMQADLAEKTVQSSVGGGKVTVTANGAGEVTEIKIDPSIVDPDDIEILEDLVLSGVTQAIEQGKSIQAEEMQKITGGLGLPPGMGL